MNTATNQSTWVMRALDKVERVGNKLSTRMGHYFCDMFSDCLDLFSYFFFNDLEAIDPRSGQPVQINNLLTGAALADFMMVSIFTGFAPLRVLVAMLGVGSGLVSILALLAGLKRILDSTPRTLLTPMVARRHRVPHRNRCWICLSAIPLAGVIFYAMGRHPLAGIAAAFAGVMAFVQTLFLQMTTRYCNHSLKRLRN